MVNFKRGMIFSIFLYIILDVAILYAMFMTDVTGVRVYALAIGFVAILALIGHSINYLQSLPDDDWLTPSNHRENITKSATYRH